MRATSICLGATSAITFRLFERNIVLFTMIDTRNRRRRRQQPAKNGSEEESKCQNNESKVKENRRSFAINFVGHFILFNFLFSDSLL